MRQRIFFITQNRLKAFDWDGLHLEGSYEFFNHEEGVQDFDEFLKCADLRLSKVLVEILEEDFQKDTIPHVYGNDKKMLVKRLVDKHYRGQRYVYTHIIGREESGRRDDEVLLASITNPEAIDIWISALDKYNVPLMGIWSLPMLSRVLLDKLEVNSDSVLLVSRQMRSTIRESFFRRGKLVLSRQVKLKREERKTDLVKGYISEGISQIHKYLSNQRIIAFGSSLDVFCLLPESLIEKANKEYQNTETLVYQFYSLESAFEKFKLDMAESCHADTLLSYVCTQQMVGSEHYHPGDEKNAFYAFIIDRTYTALASFGSLILFIISAIFLIEILDANNKEKYVVNQTDLLSRSYDLIYSPIEYKIDNAQTIYSVVQHAERLESESSISTENVLIPLSEILAKPIFSSIELAFIEWKKLRGAELETLRTSIWRATTAGVTEDDQYPYVESEQDDKVGTLLIRGVLMRGDLGYRQAVNVFDAFIEQVEALSEVKQVFVVAAPVDTREIARFSDRQGSEQELSVSSADGDKFEIMLILPPSESELDAAGVYDE